MPLSKAKRERLEMKKRREFVNSCFLNGKGYFMGAPWQAYADEYVGTGDKSLLAYFPSEPRELATPTPRR